MNFIWFLLIGILAGTLATKFMNTSSGYGMPGDLGLGVVGAVLGGFVFGLLGLAAAGLWGRLVTATVGAVLLIAVMRMVKKS